MVRKLLQPVTNEVGNIQILGVEEFDENYNTHLGGRNSNYISAYHVAEFDVALELAKDNPNKYIKFFALYNEDLERLKRQCTAAQSYYKNYFKRNNLNNYSVTRRTQGNKVTFFITNHVSDEEQ